MLILSFTAVLFSREFSLTISRLFEFYLTFSTPIETFFQQGPISQLLVYIIGITLLMCMSYLPLLLIFKFGFKKKLPYKNHILWFLWLLFTLTILLSEYLLGRSI